jgi:hypothetical protein
MHARGARPSVKAPARHPEGIGSLSTDQQQPTGIEYLRGELLDRVDAQPFEDWSPALLRALIAVFDLNGATPPAQHGFRPHLVR